MTTDRVAATGVATARDTATAVATTVAGAMVPVVAAVMVPEVRPDPPPVTIAVFPERSNIERSAPAYMPGSGGASLTVRSFPVRAFMNSTRSFFSWSVRFSLKMFLLNQGFGLPPLS